MATQKNTKSSKATAPKSKASKAAPVKKSVSKAPIKGKQIVKSASALKSKTTGKVLPAAKTKKAVPVTKKAAPVTKKATPVTKKAAPVAKKTAPVTKKAAPVTKKPAASKAKPASKPISKPTAKKYSPAKVTSAKPKATPGKQAQRVQTKPASASKPASQSIAKTTFKTASPSKTVTSKALEPTNKIQPKPSAPLVKKPIASLPVVSAKVIGATKKQVSPTAGSQSKLPKAPAKLVATAKTPETPNPLPKSAPDKPDVVPTKSALKPTGSKISDLAKPSVSSKPMAEKPKEQQKAKEFQRKSLKQSTVHSVKPFDTMLDKKENKPMGATYSDEPQKTRYNDKELEEFDQLIDQKLIVAREQLEFYLKQLEDMAENPDNKIKGLDDGLSTLESERVSSMAARQQKLIQHLENAKIRIKNKVYGICRETGRLISKERLRAVPHATLSIEAKQAQN